MQNTVTKIGGSVVSRSRLKEAQLKEIGVWINPESVLKGSDARCSLTSQDRAQLKSVDADLITKIHGLLKQKHEQTTKLIGAVKTG